jgi:hypothetical protein
MEDEGGYVGRSSRNKRLIVGGRGEKVDHTETLLKV